MPRVSLRFGLLLSAAVASAVFVAHAQPPAPESARAEPPSSFFFPEDPDASRQYEAVTDYMSRKAIPWDVVSAAAQRRLDARSDSFYTPKDKATGRPVGDPFSIKTRVGEVIGKFPKDGKEFYELSFGPPADTLLKEAVKDGYDRAKLADCAQRYFHTKAGTQAALLLAALDLDAGNYAESAAGYQRLLARADADALATPRLVFKAAVAFKRSGDPRQADAALKLWDRLAREFPRDGLTVGRKAYTLDELRAEFDRPPDEKAARWGEGVVAMRYGNPAHVSLADAGVPFLDAAFDAPMFGRTTESAADGEGWVRQHRAEAYKQLDRSRGQVALPGFFPVTAPGLVIYRSYDGVVAVAAKDGYRSQGVSFRPGQLVWSSPTIGGLQSLIGGEDRGLSEQAKQAWKWYADKYPSVVFENAAVGSLSHDGRLVYFVDDVALPPPPLAIAQNFGAVPGGGALSRGPADFNRLVAVDLQTGSVKWSLGGLTDTPLTDAEEQTSTNTYRLTENALFLGPPLPVNGKLYALYERNGAVAVACLDPARVVLETLPDGTKRSYPELVWSQPVGCGGEAVPGSAPADPAGVPGLRGRGAGLPDQLRRGGGGGRKRPQSAMGTGVRLPGRSVADAGRGRDRRAWPTVPPPRRVRRGDDGPGPVRQRPGPAGPLAGGGPADRRRPGGPDRPRRDPARLSRPADRCPAVGRRPTAGRPVRRRDCRRGGAGGR